MLKPLFLALGLLVGSWAQAGGAASPPPTAATTTFSNPVLDANFPDPFVLRAGTQYHAYATNGSGGNVPHAVSRDLVHWERAGDAMPVLPAWVQPGLTWAPEVVQLAGRYVLYFTARDLKSGRQCIGVATAAQPAGPFRGQGSGPLVCQVEEGGSIDASPFVDTDGRAYLLWKNDGNCCNLSTRIYLQPLARDGLSLTGKPTDLIQNFQLWEGAVIEAPTLHKAGGTYYLLYSGGPFDSDLYAVGYATASKVTGPYSKSADNPVLTSRGAVAGPGHQSVVTDGAGQTWLVYHAWTTGQIGDQLGYRSMRLDRVTFSGGRLKVSGPTLTPQPAPRPAR
ncbi:glycoside hydrolase family 43 protein [Deinococcus multiflagellatus]|uniref:glycoside hydrolase family 43 protein n=1 Tax=Deinococcus multiflagellatus TaxID=1656887 RepID=UPI001CCA4AD1|nr:glycoside hydrolase family 43 protein [Deinococcus multiflagellatus]MBZ9712917.1 glycoside hydrolase family 43 protein [Deinococcus multiflagellatus]